MNANEVAILITARDEATKVMKDVGDSAQGAASSMTKIGVAAAGISFVAVGAGLVSSFNAAADFEQQISAVAAVSQATKGELEALADAGKRIGRETSFSATEAAKAMEILAANGVAATDIINGGADAAVALAAAGGTDLVTAADLASTAMTVWGLKTSDMTDVVNRMAGAANASRFGVEDMALAVAQGGGAAASAGVEFGDFTTAIAAIAPSFSSGSDAGTSFKTFLARLIPEGDKASSMMTNLGLRTADGANAFFDAQGNMKSMAEVADLLHNATKDLTEQEKAQALQVIFGTDAMRAAAAMSKLTGEEFKKMDDTMRTSDAAAIASQRMDNARGAMESLKGSIEVIQIEIGERLTPIFAVVALWLAEKLPAAFDAASSSIGSAIKVIGTLRDYFKFAWEEGDTLNDYLESVPEPLRGVAKAFADVLMFIQSDVLPVIREVGRVFRDDVMPAAQQMAEFVVGQIAMLVAHLDEHFARFPAYYNEEVKPALDNIREAVTTVVTEVVQFFSEHWPEIMSIVQPVLDEIINQIELAATIITGVLDIIIKLLHGDWAGAWNATKNLFAEVWDSMKESISNAKDFIVGVLSALRDIGVAMVGGLLEGAASKLGELANWFFALPGKIVSEIPNPLDVLYNIGKQIIQGLINGITSMIGSLVSSVGGAISSIPAAAKKILGIFSPSRVMFGLGERVAEGFALGITDGMKSMVIPEAGRMAASVPNTIAGSSPGVATSGASGGGFGGGPVYNYTINVQALDGTSAAQIIMRELVKWERRGGIAPGTTRAVA